MAAAVLATTPSSSRSCWLLLQHVGELLLAAVLLLLCETSLCLLCLCVWALVVEGC